MYRPRSFACITALTVAALASAVLAPSATPAAAASAKALAAAPRIVVPPDAVRLPGQPRQAPLTTEQCEETEAIACYSPDPIRAAYDLPPISGRGITGAAELR